MPHSMVNAVHATEAVCFQMASVEKFTICVKMSCKNTRQQKATSQMPFGNTRVASHSMMTVAGSSLTRDWLLVLSSIPGPRFPVSLIAYGMPNARRQAGVGKAQDIPSLRGTEEPVY